jgi:hypothetical protein
VRQRNLEPSIGAQPFDLHHTSPHPQVHSGSQPCCHGALFPMPCVAVCTSQIRADWSEASWQSFPTGSRSRLLQPVGHSLELHCSCRLECFGVCRSRLRFWRVRLVEAVNCIVQSHGAWQPNNASNQIGVTQHGWWPRTKACAQPCTKPSANPSAQPCAKPAA